ncbi:putative peptidoglycan binding protein [Humitalea rosea]|uniref:Putative peptidoglycan binding protein n=2 Tax=Humitalea rosea TaxID=990373 RepID=A0A2W7JF30_9PROT|nr:peptidoglycan-binding domain-containing protein [Humitalea rosea]PZW50358.1 putative peptidoglycan binding protein [Humitalea rosea]
MLLIRRGDRGPRVVMIQGILRAQGAHIDIDGAYGPNTAAAVSAFQQRAGGLLADGTIGLDTWRAIERVTGYRIINVVDAEDSAQRQRVCSGLTRAGGNPIIMYGMSNAVAAAMDEVVARAGAGGMTAMVRFYSHGGPGMQNVASGHDGGNMGHLSGVSVQHFPAMRAQFERLNDILAPFGCVDMMGCSVGDGAQGDALLNGISDAANRPAEAGIQVQYSQDEGHKVFNFEGPVKASYPGRRSRQAWGRHVQGWIGPLRRTG